MNADFRSLLTQYRFPALSASVQKQAATVAEAREIGNPLRLSASGSCARRLAYQRINFETPSGVPKPCEVEPLNPRALMVFHLGDMVETSLKAWIRDAGSLFMPLAPPADRVSISVCGVEIPGHPDGLYQESDGTYSVVSIKSINTLGFDRVERDGPPYEHICQETAYMAALGVWRARFLYYNKNTSHLMDDWVVDFSPDLYAEIAKRWVSVIMATPDVLPEPEYRAVPETEWVRGLKGYKAGTATFNEDGTPGSAVFDVDGKRITEVKSNGYHRETGRAVLPWQCSYCPFKRPCYGERLRQVEVEDGQPTWVVEAA